MSTKGSAIKESFARGSSGSSPHYACGFDAGVNGTPEPKTTSRSAGVSFFVAPHKEVP